MALPAVDAEAVRGLTAAAACRSTALQPFPWRKLKLPGEIRVLTRPSQRPKALTLQPARQVASLYLASPPDAPYERQRPRIYGGPADGTAIEESLADIEEAREFWPFARNADFAPPTIKLPCGARQRRLSGEVHILLKQTYDLNYGHWLVDCLPKLELVARNFDLSTCKIIVSDWPQMRQVYLDTLAAFGIGPHQIV